MVEFSRQRHQPIVIGVDYFSTNQELRQTWETQPHRRHDRLFTDRFWLLMGSDRAEAFGMLSSLVMSRVVTESAFDGVGLLYNDSGVGQLLGRDKPATIFTLATARAVPPNAEALTDELLTATNADLAIIGSELVIPLGSQERVSATA